MPWKWIELKLSLQTNTLLSTAVTSNPFLLDWSFVRKLLLLPRSSVVCVNKSCCTNKWINSHISGFLSISCLSQKCTFETFYQSLAILRRQGGSHVAEGRWERHPAAAQQGDSCGKVKEALQTCSGRIYLCCLPFRFQETTSTNCPKEMLRNCLHEKKTLIVRR